MNILLNSLILFTLTTAFSGSTSAQNFAFDVDPETFLITVENAGIKEQANLSSPKMRVTNLKRTPSAISWTYPESKVSVSIEKKYDFLDINITSIGATSFTWPQVQADNYTLPLGEGKYIPAKDPYWKEFLKDQTYKFIENFSMSFFALNKARYSIIYVAKSMFNDEIHFTSNPKISFSFSHKYPTINKEKTYGFRLYITNNDPVAISQVYKNYITEQSGLKTLAAKEDENPNISKLYGAPHIYLWPVGAISSGNINWERMQAYLKQDTKFLKWLKKLLNEYTDQGEQGFATAVHECSKQNYANDYQKKVIVRTLSDMIALKQLYNPEIFPNLDSFTLGSVNKGIETLSEQELYTFNKSLIKSELNNIIDDVAAWGKEDVNFLEEMHNAGVTKAWLGLSEWSDGLKNPSLIEKANQLGYLIGPYDNYHDIHAKGSIRWSAASFKDSTLYEAGSVTDVNGIKIKGFLGVGRKLNATMSLPSVKERLNDILHNNIPFNSWFIDCDATGEIYDDYSAAHITTQKEDLHARLQRMDYIRKEKHMVIGSEGGNDFAANVIAFAHGIETPVIAWSDPDMRTNVQSPYYVGGWEKENGIPAIFVKQVPLKTLYKHIFLDPVYTIPLFKLVYNNVVIPTHHWAFGSLKIKGEICNTMLHEMLYNTPPLYHLNPTVWRLHKNLIVNHVKNWSALHEQAVQLSMTAFKVLSKDRMVQSTTFGNKLTVFANFSDKDFQYKKKIIKAHSAIVDNGVTAVEYRACEF